MFRYKFSPPLPSPGPIFVLLLIALMIVKVKPSMLIFQGTDHSNHKSEDVELLVLSVYQPELHWVSKGHHQQPPWSGFLPSLPLLSVYLLLDTGRGGQKWRFCQPSGGLDKWGRLPSCHCLSYLFRNWFPA